MAQSDDLGLSSVQKLQSADQMELLNVVDSLRACGLSEIVALPQLIVCVDQSSGKSSVLEAISGIPFPKQDTLCTRFATEVILRRAKKVEINVSIVPSDNRAIMDRDQLLRFRREIKTKDDLEDLFKSARAEMGLASSEGSFSNDILRVEFCGPDQPQLSLVDLPGLIHSETKSQSPGDVQLVHGLVSRYLKNPRSIILAVVSAKNDIGNQIILQNARNVDPQGLRTLGVITKPDLLVKGSKSEEAFITLARNEDVKFSLGWHVVKNLDSAEIRDQQEDTRDKEETLFFEESGFSRLPAHLIGITPLRTRLSKVLFSQIRRELPRLVEDIQIQITAARIARDRLGPSRSKPEQQREFLISLSQTFQTICRDAVKGDYDHEFFQGDANPERRLCANVMNMHFDFAKNIRKNGALWLVNDERASDKNYRSRNEAIMEACTLLKTSRGRELPGLPNPLLVGELFRQYSRPWGDFARLHIKKVWEAANRFLELLLQHLTDEDVCETVFNIWLHPIMEEKLNLAYSKLDELLEVHKDYPMTTNSNFISQSRTAGQDSTKNNLASMLRDCLKSGKNLSVDEITQMMSTMTTTADLDMDMVAAEEAFDNMNAYYDVAMNLFTDNVPTLAVQAPIIRQVPNAFCPTAVYSMDAVIVNRIAGETEEKTAERDSILRRLATLEEGVLICKQYAKRPQRPQQVFYLSSDENGLSEQFVSGSRRPGNEGKNTPGKPTSNNKPFPESVPGTGSMENFFASLSARPQIGNGSRGAAPSPSTLQNDKTSSPKHGNTEPRYIQSPSDSGVTKSTDARSVKPNPSNRSSGSEHFPSGSISGKPSPTRSSAENTATRPIKGVFSTLKSSPIAGSSLFASDAPFWAATTAFGAQSAFGDTSSTKSIDSVPVKPKLAILEGSLESAPHTTSGSAFGPATSNTSSRGSGAFAGISPANNDDKLNKVPNKI